MDISIAKQEIIKTSKMMYRSGMVNMFEGNISMRFGDKFLITPSQQSKEDMLEEMIVELDAEGAILNPSEKYKPSSELTMHLAAYSLRPDVNAIVHNHSAYATAYAIAGQAISSDALTELNFIFGNIPVVPYGTPGTKRIHEHFDTYLKYNNAVLLSNHGVLTLGPNLTIAYSIAEAVEKIAQTLLLSKLLGKEKPLPAEELKQIRELGLEHRKKAIEIKYKDQGV